MGFVRLAIRIEASSQSQLRHSGNPTRKRGIESTSFFPRSRVGLPVLLKHHQYDENKAHAEKAGKNVRELLISHIDKTGSLPKWLAEKGYVSHQSGKWWEGSYQRGGFTEGMKYPPTSGEPQLYDLKSDPGETNNLASKNRERVKQLSALLDEWYVPDQRQVGKFTPVAPKVNRERKPTRQPRKRGASFERKEQHSAEANASPM